MCRRHWRYLCMDPLTSSPTRLSNRLHNNIFEKKIKKSKKQKQNVHTISTFSTFWVPRSLWEIPPFSILAYFMPSTLALSLRLDDDERDNIFQRLEKMLFAPRSVKMGRRSGRQAPTMPNEDSTMGQ